MKSPPPDQTESPNIKSIGCQSVRQWSGFLSLRAIVRCVEKLRTVLPFTVGIRDGVEHLVSTSGSAVI
jgi:hypothetical protein